MSTFLSFIPTDCSCAISRFGSWVWSKLGSRSVGQPTETSCFNVYGHWIEASDQAAATVLGDLLGNGDKAPTSPPSPPARAKARGAGTRPRSGPEGAPQ